MVHSKYWEKLEKNIKNTTKCGVFFVGLVSYTLACKSVSRDLLTRNLQLDGSFLVNT